jgi:hypothetical protein
MSAEAKIKIDILAALIGAKAVGTPRSDIDSKTLISLADGSGADQINQIFSDQRTLTASSSEDLDLNGTLANQLGATINFTKIKGIIITAAAGNTNDVIVGGATTNGFIDFVGAATHTLKVKPGGLLALMAPGATGYGVTAATADLLKIANGGAGSSVTYDIILLGVE